MTIAGSRPQRARVRQARRRGASGGAFLLRRAVRASTDAIRERASRSRSRPRRPSSARAQGTASRSTVTLSTAFGCPFEGRIDPGLVADIAARVVDAGPNEVLLADTIGVAVPRQVGALVVDVASARVPVGVHLHNTRNTGYANALAALSAGATLLDTSLGGIGGLSLRSPGDGQHRDRGSRLPPRRRGNRDGSRPRRVDRCRRLARGDSRRGARGSGVPRRPVSSAIVGAHRPCPISRRSASCPLVRSGSVHQVLVLNASYEPLNVCSDRRAHVLVWKGKAEVVEEHRQPLAIRGAVVRPSACDSAAPVRAGSSRREAPDLPPRALCPGRVEVRLLRYGGGAADARPRDSALEGWRLGVGERRHGLCAVQPPQGRPLARGDVDDAPATAAGARSRSLHPSRRAEGAGELAAVSALARAVRARGGVARPSLRRCALRHRPRGRRGTSRTREAAR